MKFWVKAVVDLQVGEQLLVSADSIREIQSQLEDLLDISIGTMSISDFQRDVVDQLNNKADIIKIIIRKAPPPSEEDSSPIAASSKDVRRRSEATSSSVEPVRRNTITTSPSLSSVTSTTTAAGTGATVADATTLIGEGGCNNSSNNMSSSSGGVGNSVTSSSNINSGCAAGSLHRRLSSITTTTTTASSSSNNSTNNTGGGGTDSGAGVNTTWKSAPLGIITSANTSTTGRHERRPGNLKKRRKGKISKEKEDGEGRGEGCVAVGNGEGEGKRPCWAHQSSNSVLNSSSFSAGLGSHPSALPFNGGRGEAGGGSTGGGGISGSATSLVPSSQDGIANLECNRSTMGALDIPRLSVISTMCMEGIRDEGNPPHHHHTNMNSAGGPLLSGATTFCAPLPLSHSSSTMHPIGCTRMSTVEGSDESVEGGQNLSILLPGGRGECSKGCSLSSAAPPSPSFRGEKGGGGATRKTREREGGGGEKEGERKTKNVSRYDAKKKEGTRSSPSLFPFTASMLSSSAAEGEGEKEHAGGLEEPVVEEGTTGKDEKGKRKEETGTEEEKEGEKKDNSINVSDSVGEGGSMHVAMCTAVPVTPPRIRYAARPTSLAKLGASVLPPNAMLSTSFGTSTSAFNTMTSLPPPPSTCSSSTAASLSAAAATTSLSTSATTFQPMSANNNNNTNEHECASSYSIASGGMNHITITPPPTPSKRKKISVSSSVNDLQPAIEKICLSRDNMLSLLQEKFEGKFMGVIQGCFARVREPNGYVIYQISEMTADGNVILDRIYSNDKREILTISNANPMKDELSAWMKKMLSCSRPFPSPGFIEAKHGDVMSALRVASALHSLEEESRGASGPSTSDNSNRSSSRSGGDGNSGGCFGGSSSRHRPHPRPHGGGGERTDEQESEIGKQSIHSVRRETRVGKPADLGVLGKGSGSVSVPFTTSTPPSSASLTLPPPPPLSCSTTLVGGALGGSGLDIAAAGVANPHVEISQDGRSMVDGSVGPLSFSSLGNAPGGGGGGIVRGSTEKRRPISLTPSHVMVGPTSSPSGNPSYCGSSVSTSNSTENSGRNDTSNHTTNSSVGVGPLSSFSSNPSEKPIKKKNHDKKRQKKNDGGGGVAEDVRNDIHRRKIVFFGSASSSFTHSSLDASPEVSLFRSTSLITKAMEDEGLGGRTVDFMNSDVGGNREGGGVDNSVAIASTTTTTTRCPTATVGTAYTGIHGSTEAFSTSLTASHPVVPSASSSSSSSSSSAGGGGGRRPTPQGSLSPVPPLPSSVSSSAFCVPFSSLSRMTPADFLPSPPAPSSSERDQEGGEEGEEGGAGGGSVGHSSGDCSHSFATAISLIPSCPFLKLPSSNEDRSGSTSGEVLVGEESMFPELTSQVLEGIFTAEEDSKENNKEEEKDGSHRSVVEEEDLDSQRRCLGGENLSPRNEEDHRAQRCEQEQKESDGDDANGGIGEEKSTGTKMMGGGKKVDAALKNKPVSGQTTRSVDAVSMNEKGNAKEVERETGKVNALVSSLQTGIPSAVRSELCSLERGKGVESVRTATMNMPCTSAALSTSSIVLAGLPSDGGLVFAPDTSHTSAVELPSSHASSASSSSSSSLPSSSLLSSVSSLSSSLSLSSASLSLSSFYTSETSSTGKEKAKDCSPTPLPHAPAVPPDPPYPSHHPRHHHHHHSQFHSPHLSRAAQTSDKTATNFPKKKGTLLCASADTECFEKGENWEMNKKTPSENGRKTAGKATSHRQESSSAFVRGVERHTSEEEDRASTASGTMITRMTASINENRGHSYPHASHRHSGRTDRNTESTPLYPPAPLAPPPPLPSSSSSPSPPTISTSRSAVGGGGGGNASGSGVGAPQLTSGLPCSPSLPGLIVEVPNASSLTSPSHGRKKRGKLRGGGGEEDRMTATRTTSTTTATRTLLVSNATFTTSSAPIPLLPPATLLPSHPLLFSPSCRASSLAALQALSSLWGESFPTGRVSVNLNDSLLHIQVKSEFLWISHPVFPLQSSSSSSSLPSSRSSSLSPGSSFPSMCSSFLSVPFSFYHHVLGGGGEIGKHLACAYTSPLSSSCYSAGNRFGKKNKKKSMDMMKEGGTEGGEENGSSGCIFGTENDLHFSTANSTSTRPLLDHRLVVIATRQSNRNLAMRAFPSITTNQCSSNAGTSTTTGGSTHYMDSNALSGGGGGDPHLAYPSPFSSYHYSFSSPQSPGLWPFAFHSTGETMMPSGMGGPTPASPSPGTPLPLPSPLPPSVVAVEGGGSGEIEGSAAVAQAHASETLLSSSSASPCYYPPPPPGFLPYGFYPPYYPGPNGQPYYYDYSSHAPGPPFAPNMSGAPLSVPSPLPFPPHSRPPPPLAPPYPSMYPQHPVPYFAAAAAAPPPPPPQKSDFAGCMLTLDPVGNSIVRDRDITDKGFSLLTFPVLWGGGGGDGSSRHTGGGGLVNPHEGHFPYNPRSCSALPPSSSLYSNLNVSSSSSLSSSSLSSSSGLLFPFPPQRYVALGQSSPSSDEGPYIEDEEEEEDEDEQREEEEKEESRYLPHQRRRRRPPQAQEGEGEEREHTAALERVQAPSRRRRSVEEDDHYFRPFYTHRDSSCHPRAAAGEGKDTEEDAEGEEEEGARKRRERSTHGSYIHVEAPDFYHRGRGKRETSSSSEPLLPPSPQDAENTLRGREGARKVHGHKHDRTPSCDRIPHRRYRMVQPFMVLRGPSPDALYETSRTKLPIPFFCGSNPAQCCVTQVQLVVYKGELHAFYLVRHPSPNEKEEDDKHVSSFELSSCSCPPHPYGQQHHYYPNHHRHYPSGCDHRGSSRMEQSRREGVEEQRKKGQPSSTNIPMPVNSYPTRTTISPPTPSPPRPAAEVVDDATSAPPLSSSFSFSSFPSPSHFSKEGSTTPSEQSTTSGKINRENSGGEIFHQKNHNHCDKELEDDRDRVSLKSSLVSIDHTVRERREHEKKDSYRHHHVHHHPSQDRENERKCKNTMEGEVGEDEEDDNDTKRNRTMKWKGKERCAVDCPSSRSGGTPHKIVTATTSTRSSPSAGRRSRSSSISTAMRTRMQRTVGIHHTSFPSRSSSSISRSSGTGSDTKDDERSAANTEDKEDEDECETDNNNKNNSNMKKSTTQVPHRRDPGYRTEEQRERASTMPLNSGSSSESRLSSGEEKEEEKEEEGEGGGQVEHKRRSKSHGDEAVKRECTGDDSFHYFRRHRRRRSASSSSNHHNSFHHPNPSGNDHHKNSFRTPSTTAVDPTTRTNENENHDNNTNTCCMSTNTTISPTPKGGRTSPQWTMVYCNQPYGPCDTITHPHYHPHHQNGGVGETRFMVQQYSLIHAVTDSLSLDEAQDYHNSDEEEDEEDEEDGSTDEIEEEAAAEGEEGDTKQEECRRDEPLISPSRPQGRGPIFSSGTDIIPSVPMGIPVASSISTSTSSPAAPLPSSFSSVTSTGTTTELHRDPHDLEDEEAIYNRVRQSPASFSPATSPPHPCRDLAEKRIEKGMNVETDEGEGREEEDKEEEQEKEETEKLKTGAKDGSGERRTKLFRPSPPIVQASQFPPPLSQGPSSSTSSSLSSTNLSSIDTKEKRQYQGRRQKQQRPPPPIWRLITTDAPLCWSVEHEPLFTVSTVSTKMGGSSSGRREKGREKGGGGMMTTTEYIKEGARSGAQDGGGKGGRSFSTPTAPVFSSRIYAAAVGRNASISSSTHCHPPPPSLPHHLSEGGYNSTTAGRTQSSHSSARSGLGGQPSIEEEGGGEEYHNNSSGDDTSRATLSGGADPGAKQELDPPQSLHWLPKTRASSFSAVNESALPPHEITVAEQLTMVWYSPNPSSSFVNPSLIHSAFSSRTRRQGGGGGSSSTSHYSSRRSTYTLLDSFLMNSPAAAAGRRSALPFQRFTMQIPSSSPPSPSPYPASPPVGDGGGRRHRARPSLTGSEGILIAPAAPQTILPPPPPPPPPPPSTLTQRSTQSTFQEASKGGAPWKEEGMIAACKVDPARVRQGLRSISLFQVNNTTYLTCAYHEDVKLVLWTIPLAPSALEA